jgi:hypothetical protein
MRLYPFLLLLLLAACGQPQDKTVALQQQIDSLQRQLHDVYRPGLGEFMSGIQVHHAKIWFAGQAQNWALADFEIGEIHETLEDIQKYCADRPEVASLPMITPALDSLAAAVAHKNGPGFKAGFILLTNTCNNCHRATKHAFNVIQVPQTPPFTNQLFGVPGAK